MAAPKLHWPEYLMEAAELAIFMIAAGLVTCLFEYPSSPVHQAIANADLRRLFIGIAMGLTAIALIYSPWGKQSGAHINPAITLTFYRLGKVTRKDALFYILFQCLGGVTGVYVVVFLLRNIFTQPPINYIVTVPGAFGWIAALLGELTIAFIMMTMILLTSNHNQLSRHTGLFAGCLVMLYVFLEAPLSGFGMNPARSFASAFPAQNWTAFPLYVIAPLVGRATPLYLLGNVQTESLGDRLQIPDAAAVPEYNTVDSTLWWRRCLPSVYRLGLANRRVCPGTLAGLWQRHTSPSILRANGKSSHGSRNGQTE